jgi:hypothetical protein
MFMSSFYLNVWICYQIWKKSWLNSILLVRYMATLLGSNITCV